VRAFANRRDVAGHVFISLASVAFCALSVLVAQPARAQTAPPANAAEDPTATAVKALTNSVAQTIKKSHLKNILVMDFQGPNKGYSPLGRKLADELSSALAADPAIRVVDRKQYTEFEYREALLIPDANQPDRAEWIAEQLSANAFVIGELEEVGNEFVLQITIYDCPKPRMVQELKATFPKTDETSALARQRLTATGDDLRNENKKRESMPHYGLRGYSVPECQYCPSPEFSSEATRRKFEGTVTLVAEIDETGHITDAAVLEGSFYGLNDKALETVKRWRMRPAVGPDGSPAAVQQIVELTFRTYR
jgi:TonB family protein